MLLDRFLAGRFASHHSPERERREVLFAIPNPGQTNADENTSEQIAGETSRSISDGQQPQSIAELMRTETMNVLQENLDELYRAPEIADHLIASDYITQDQLADIARATGISIDGEKDKNVCVYLRILKNITVAQRGPFIERLEPLVKECLSRHPRITLRSAWEVEHRIEVLENLERSIETILNIDSAIVELQKEIIDMQDDNLEDNPMIDTLEKKLKNHIETSARKHRKELDVACERHFRNLAIEKRLNANNRPGMPTMLTLEEKDGIRNDALLNISLNAQKKLRRRKNFGGGQSPQSAEEIEAPQTVLSRMHRERAGLTRILDEQLLRHSWIVLSRHKERFDRMMQTLGLPDAQSLEDAQRIILRRTPQTDAAYTPEIAQREQEVADDLERKFLTTHGISIVTMLMEFDQLMREVKRQNRVPSTPGSPREEQYITAPEPTDPSFLTTAGNDIVIWERCENDLASGRGDLHRMRQDQDDTEAWAFAMADLLHKAEENLPNDIPWNEHVDLVRKILGIPESDKNTFLDGLEKIIAVLRPYMGKSSKEERKEIRQHLDLCVTPATFPPELQSRIQRCLALLAHPSLLHDTSERAQAIDERIHVETAKTEATTAVELVCKQTRDRLHSAFGILIQVRKNDDERDPTVRYNLYTPLRHQLCDFLKIGGLFAGRKRQLEQQLSIAYKDMNRDATAALRSAHFVRYEVEKLEQCVRFLDEIDRRKEFETMPANVLAEYDRAECRIKINRGIRSQKVDAAYEHERGHAILHILTSRTGLFPYLVPLTYDAHKDVKDAETGETFERLLLGLKDYGSYGNLERQKLEGNDRIEAFTEELLVRYADWKRQQESDEGGKSFHENELALFRILESGATLVQETGLNKRLHDRLERVKFHNEDDDRARQPAEKKEIFTMKGSLSETERALRNVKLFLDAYTKDPQLSRDDYDAVATHYNNAHEEWERLSKKFTKKDLWTNVPPPTPPEEEEREQNACKDLEEFAKKIEGVVLKYEADRLDITREQRFVSPMQRLFEGIRFVSINDIVKLWKDTMEDFGSIFKRRQDRLLKDVGYAITKPMQDSALLKNIPLPWINQYLPGLHAYHQRRYSGTEVEAADKWKDGMKNDDSHTLLHFIHNTRNRDAVRGIIALLCERGEMDWNNPSVWKTLSALSGYEMPEGPCKRSDVLRDTWLRKLISYIWNDKELYYHWRSENDSKIKSGKEHFTAWVDQLSNVGGGMRAELRKQLRLFTEWDKHYRHHGTPPEDVKPHLYEKVLHYAISNGKMTMEDKFYYLIRGVASGLLSIDRLRTLAGEEGGVLNQFPFIDYFYGRNNTLPEIKALADRLTEKSEGKDTFTPGKKTTLWIQLELVRDRRVQERLSKGTSRTSSETIDHEDIPLFLPQLDYNSVRGMANVISGSRQKMSPEALKNLYCGYSSKFKVFARLAQLDKKGKERFTPEDALILADAIGAYVDIDNILTRKGYEADTRPTLTRSQMQQMAVSGDGKHQVIEYRRNMNRFVARLIKNLKTAGVDIEESPEWRAFKDQHHKEDRKIDKKPNPQTGALEDYEKPAKPFEIWDYVTKESELDAMKSNKKDVATKLFEGTRYFVDALKKILPQNVEVLKRTLMEVVDDSNKNNRFFDEGGSSDDDGITLASAEAAIADKRLQRDYTELPASLAI